MKSQDEIRSPWTPNLDKNHNIAYYGNKSGFNNMKQPNDKVRYDLYSPNNLSHFGGNSNNNNNNRLGSNPNLPNPQPNSAILRSETCGEIQGFGGNFNLTQFDSSASIPEGNDNWRNQGSKFQNNYNGNQFNSKFPSQPELSVPYSADRKKKGYNNKSGAFGKNNNGFASPQRNFSSKQELGGGGENVIDMIENNIIQKIMQKVQGSENASNLTLEALSKMDHEELLKIHKDIGKVLDNKSQVLHINGLENKQIQASMLNSIFSNFGNIQKILFIKHKATAFIEFTNVEGAATAKDYLNNIVFMGKPMRINYSTHTSIQIPKQ